MRELWYIIVAIEKERATRAEIERLGSGRALGLKEVEAASLSRNSRIDFKL
jgi:hypothetical protein